MSHSGILQAKPVGLIVLFVLILGFSLVLPSGALADTVTLSGISTNITLQISDPDAGYTNINAIIDPYTGALDGKSVLLWCVDPDHESSYGSWGATVSPLGSNLGSTYLKNATTYGEMAWLITQLRSATLVTAQQELQAAIWSIAEGATPNAPTATGDFSITVPYGDPNFAANVSKDISNASTHVLTSGFEILTDSSGKEQEFMVITPEPSTLGLLGIGLIAVFTLASNKSRRCSV